MAGEAANTHIMSMYTMILYFLVSTLVTFTNKAILNQARCGYLLTGVHGLATYIGCLMFNSTTDAGLVSGSFKRYILLGFALMYMVNIAMSNVSLAMVPLAVHATIRSSGPAITAVVWFLVDRSRQVWNTPKVLSLLLLSAGAMLVASVNSQSKRPAVVGITSTGLFLTFLGALTAILKTILTNKLCTDVRISLSINQILIIITPCAALQAFTFGYLNDELEILRTAYIDGGIDKYWALLVVINAMLACLLNIASFRANKTCGPTAVAIAASVKQVLLLWEPSRMLRDGLPIEIMAGTVMSAAGTLWYSLSRPQSKVVVTEEGRSREKVETIEKEL